MSGWFAPRPGGTSTPAARPGATLATAPAAAGSSARPARPSGTAVLAPRPGGSWWSGVAQPPLPVHTEHRTAGFATDATLSVATLPVVVVGAGYSTEAVLSVSTAQRLELGAALAAEGTLSVSVVVVGEMFEADAEYSTDAALSVATLPRFGPLLAPLAADAALSVVTFPRHEHTAAFGAEGTLSVATFPRHARVADYSTEGTLSVVVAVVPQRAAPFATEGTLGVLTFPRHAHAAALATEGILSVVVVQKTNWTDNFNRANGGLGADWTGLPLGVDTTVVPEINSNALRAKSTASNNQNNQCMAVATAAAAECLTDNMATRATMVAGENGLIMGIMARCSSDGQNVVTGNITSDGNTTGIFTRIGGTWVRRTTTSTTAFAAGDVAEMRANGNVYSLIRNPDTTNTTISTWTDASNLYPVGAGRRRGGVYHNSDRNAFSTQNWAPALDNFNVRDL